ncbi:MAG: hypothetical protein KDK53_15815 [Maritimibacter sp.]|nr:hypothetical protein [Maritimibacter sp.]
MRHKRNAWMGVVGGLGVVVALAGFVGGWMTPRDTIVVTFAVWILGATLVRVFTDPPGKS